MGKRGVELEDLGSSKQKNKKKRKKEC